MSLVIAFSIVAVLFFDFVLTQIVPASPIHPSNSPEERQPANEGTQLPRLQLPIDHGKAYPLAELIDLAEAHNPETRVAWENALAQAAALGIARSELYPLVSAVALAGVERYEVPLGAEFYRQTAPTFQASLDLSYTIFDFGARRGRIDAENARVLAANF